MEPLKIGTYVHLKSKPGERYMIRNMVTHKPLLGGIDTYEYEIVSFNETKPVLRLSGDELIVDSIQL